MADLRTCKECEIDKPLTDYYKSGKNTWRRKCKDCYKERCKKTRQEKPDLHNLYCSRWREKNKEKWREYDRTYKRTHYDPVKKKIQNHYYYWGRPSNEITLISC